MGGRTGFMGMLDRALDLGISARRVFNVNDLDGKRMTTPVPLIAAAQVVAVVAARTDLNPLGPEIAVDGFTRVSLWVSLDIGVMTGIRFACYGRHTSGGANYAMPIYNPVVAAVPYLINFTDEEVVYADDGHDDTFVLTWDIANTFPIIIFGVGATADPGGGDDASILLAHTTYGWGS